MASLVHVDVTLGTLVSLGDKLDKFCADWAQYDNNMKSITGLFEAAQQCSYNGIHKLTLPWQIVKSQPGIDGKKKHFLKFRIYHTKFHFVSFPYTLHHEYRGVRRLAEVTSISQSEAMCVNVQGNAVVSQFPPSLQAPGGISSLHCRLPNARRF